MYNKSVFVNYSTLENAISTFVPLCPTLGQVTGFSVSFTQEWAWKAPGNDCVLSILVLSVTTVSSRWSLSLSGCDEWLYLLNWPFEKSIKTITQKPESDAIVHPVIVFTCLWELVIVLMCELCLCTIMCIYCLTV